MNTRVHAILVRAVGLFVLACGAGLPIAAAAEGDAGQPQWIWATPKASGEQVVALRKQIETASGVASARLTLCADDAFEVWINGKQLLAGKDWERPSTVDCADAFVSGDNVLVVIGRNKQGSAGVVAQLNLEPRGGAAMTIVSDGSWQAQLIDGVADGAKLSQIAAIESAAWQPAAVLDPLGKGPRANLTPAKFLGRAAASEPTATPVKDIRLPAGFVAELLYSVPKSEQGSWVSMATDPQGRLIVCDQYGGLFRVTPAPLGGQAEQTKVEKIDVPLGSAQGLLWAFDSLYVVVNARDDFASGLYRVRDTNGDDRLDQVTLLRDLGKGGGEHGPHAVMLHPSGKSLVVVCGNQVDLTEFSSSRVPRIWDEDQLLPRVFGRGFMRTTTAPGGWIAEVDPEGKEWKLMSAGYRNEYDAAFNPAGDLFTYDADMEWDMNTPWYRPTRICECVSGADYGWRNGSAKWPTYFPDGTPPLVNIGPGSPTGVCFGYGAKFPEKYQRAFFAADWSYGKLYAIHMEPAGSSYQATIEEFAAASPLPLTDLVINPLDGAMYFAIGGRQVQSGLYRVTYQGTDSTAPAKLQDRTGEAARLYTLRKQIEAWHQDPAQADLAVIWSALGSADQMLAHQARVALEHQPVTAWQDRLLSETNPAIRLQALLAYARLFPRAGKATVIGKDDMLDPPLPTYPVDVAAQSPDAIQARQVVVTALLETPYSGLTGFEKQLWLRVAQVAFTRMGPPDETSRLALQALLRPEFPAQNPGLSSMLAELLVYLQTPGVLDALLTYMEEAPTQEGQIDMAKTLRLLRTDWDSASLRRFLTWFGRAATYRGGASFTLFIEEIRNDTVAILTDAQKTELEDVISLPLSQPVASPNQSRPFVKNWTVEELLPILETRLERRSFDNGKKLFGSVACYACHRFGDSGGAMGPDLTALAGRFSVRDLLESVILPSKQISDQYAAVTVLTDSGEIVTGRIVNLGGDAIRINTNMLDPNALTSVDRKSVLEMQTAAVSMMPGGLFDTLSEEEVLDLMAFLLSRGDPNHPMFAPAAGKSSASASR